LSARASYATRRYFFAPCALFTLIFRYHFAVDADVAYYASVICGARFSV